MMTLTLCPQVDWLFGALYEGGGCCNMAVCHVWQHGCLSRVGAKDT
jgi:hypothetical protein